MYFYYLPSLCFGQDRRIGLRTDRTRTCVFGGMAGRCRARPFIDILLLCCFTLSCGVTEWTWIDGEDGEGEGLGVEHLLRHTAHDLLYYAQRHVCYSLYITYLCQTQQLLSAIHVYISLP